MEGLFGEGLVLFCCGDSLEEDLKKTLMLTLKQTDIQLEYKARVDLLCLILGQNLTGS